jgi:hypothetical protein
VRAQHIAKQFAQQPHVVSQRLMRVRAHLPTIPHQFGERTHSDARMLWNRNCRTLER